MVTRLKETKMHSSRMRTAHSSIHRGGGGLLSWPFVVVFCYGLLVWFFWLKVAFWLKMVFCYGLLVERVGTSPRKTIPEGHLQSEGTKAEGHQSRRPHQKAITEGTPTPGTPWDQSPPRSRHPPPGADPPVNRILDTCLWKYYLTPNFVCER